jgi:hypothetical protein
MTSQVTVAALSRFVLLQEGKHVVFCAQKQMVTSNIAIDVCN